ncbi:MAG: hypothetical protein Q7T76_02060 [Ferruginibacter sp.]|nr:hypothetical protein [Ferruginibacter sp.]
MRNLFLFLLGVLFTLPTFSQKQTTSPSATAAANPDAYFKPVKWRNIGPFRGGRSVAATGVVGNPLTYYMGTVGGGVWKTMDAGVSWQNMTDGQLKTSSVGAIAVAESDPNIVYVGMGEHAIRGVMSSYGDGMYKSLDAGKTWTHLGLAGTKHISGVKIDPKNPNVVIVAAQGPVYGPSADRGIYKTTDGGKSWKKTLYVDENSGCADLAMDMNNPNTLYAAMWEHRRQAWQVKSGGPGSGLYKSTDGGDTWNKLEKGLPKELGKMGIAVSGANSNKLYAVIESDTEKEQGGVFVSADGGNSWSRSSKDHNTVHRAWYYVEIAADPLNEEVVYVMSSPMLKSIDGGKNFSFMSTMHGDHHNMWINPRDSKNIILADDGGAVITFNGGQSWSSQANQPTAQMYRVNADNLFPYNVYGGQQDNTSVKISSRSTYNNSIDERDWTYSAGGESAFLAFDPNNPKYVMGGSYQGTIEVLDQQTMEGRPIMQKPLQYQSLQPKNMRYRFNWNAPIICSPHDPNTFYHGGNVLFKTTNMGKTWKPVSPDLTRHDSTKMGVSGIPFTNEGAGGENYCTLTYINESPLEKGVIYTGSDDGLVQLTKDGGASWTNITPSGLGECLINSIEVSPHAKGTAYIATSRYKFNDFTPGLYKTNDYGKSWNKINSGIDGNAYTRVVREDVERKDLLYAGTETGLYISYNGGAKWNPFQLNLPVTPITDLKLHQGDLIAATGGRSFWILDDIGLLRQYDASMKASGLALYKPEDTYRVSGSSQLDRVVKEDPIGPAPTGTAGMNPATGVVLYYDLPAKLDSAAELTLEILDAQNNLVRKYTNKANEKFSSYPGGPGAEPVLNANAGLNRFVWDLRYTTLPGVTGVYIEGSYRGHRAAPGTYTARLKMGSQEKTVSFLVKSDPRITATAAEYTLQHQTLTAIEKGVQEIHLAVTGIRKAREQINYLVNLLDDDKNMKMVADSGKAVVKLIQDWEEKLVQHRSQSYDDIINFENKLSADYIFLRGETDVNTPHVTDGQLEVLEELNDKWAILKKELQSITEGHIKNFNKLCADKKLEKITVMN